jgi:hypothetical protein
VAFPPAARGRAQDNFGVYRIVLIRFSRFQCGIPRTTRFKSRSSYDDVVGLCVIRHHRSDVHFNNYRASFHLLCTGFIAIYLVYRYLAPEDPKDDDVTLKEHNPEPKKNGV